MIRSALPRGVWWLVVATVVGCNGTEPSTMAPPPEAAMVSPNCSTPIKPTEYTLEGQVTFGEPTSVTAWFDVQGPSGAIRVEGVVDETGKVTGSTSFNQGSYTIILNVEAPTYDPVASSPLSCAVVNKVPTGRFTAPADGAEYTAEDLIVFSGVVADEDDAADTLTVALISSRDGEVATATPDSSGTFTVEAGPLTAYNHIVTLRVTDLWGAAAEANLTVVVGECEDKDGDGATDCSADCDDRDPEVYEGADEVCDDKDNDCNGQTDEIGDVDGDGFSACDECDDNDATANPGVLETCDGKDNDCDGFKDEGFDIDGDGYPSCGVFPDCDDQNPNVYPGRAEVCDGVDQNCDGQIDEGLASTYYRDADRDGFGDPNETRSVCQTEPPPGYVANDQDCDDTSAATNPTAAEACDGLDNNCDGQTDEGLSLTNFYADSDGDGYGDPNAIVQACVLPPGASENPDDCNDNDTFVSPAAPEFCDGLDQNCDGEVDEDVLLTFYADTDGDGYGVAESTTSACQAPSGYAAAAGDCAPSDPNTRPGADEACDGADNDCNGVIDDGAISKTWYQDNDGDGYGNSTQSKSDCRAPLGYVDNGLDCNDSSPTVKPGATEVCNLEDDNCDNQIDEGVKNTYYADSDADNFGDTSQAVQACTQPAGYVATSGDCNDKSKVTYPNAAELCDGIDNDCDGSLLDESPLQTFYLDNDKDGYGNPNTGLQACAAPFSYVSNKGDCNDLSALIYPGATEICDLQDNDCDTQVDEGVLVTYFADSDGDTYGNASAPKQACSLPSGHSVNNQDCNDSDRNTYPGAPELFDGKDNDCNGSVERNVALVNAPVQWSGSAKNGKLGTSLSGIGDFDGDGFSDMAFGAPRAGSGTAYVVYGAGSGWAKGGVDANVDAILTGGTAGMGLGVAVAGSDLDGDGNSDLAIGAPQNDSTQGDDTGIVYILYGGTRVANLTLANDTPDSAFVQGYLAQVQVGTSLAGGGDMNGDLIEDLLMGAPWPYITQTPPSAGVLFILPGKPNRYTGAGGIGGGSLVQLYGDSNQIIGINTDFLGDLDDDGYDDFAVSGYGKSGQGPSAISNNGVTYVIAGDDPNVLKPGSLLDAPDFDLATYTGDTAGDIVGKYLSGVGDVNDDGLPDFILGREVMKTGEAMGMLFYGGAPLPTTGTSETAADVFFTSRTGLTCPCSVGELGDINSDGISDMAISSVSSGAGSIYILLGKSGGWSRNTVIEDAANFILTGEVAGDQAGLTIAGVGDVNGDGRDDFAFGAPSYDYSGLDQSGKVYLFFGF